ncbi:MAG: hypothetical protein ABJ382_16005, partial [Ilumatobacter sp.]
KSVGRAGTREPGVGRCESEASTTTVERGESDAFVTFVVPPGLARHAELVADFIGWTPLAMDLGADGAHRARVGLPLRRHFAYQFVLDGYKVINDPAANDFDAQPNGGHASVLLT